MHSSKKKESEYKTPLLTNSVQKVYSRLLLEHMKMAPKTNGQFLQRYRSSHKIAPNPELSAFLVKINILTFKTNFYGIFFIRSGFKFGCFSLQQCSTSSAFRSFTPHFVRQAV
ncbi:hypothetical protein GS511_13930 [Leptospira borgpetersenii]|uniref:Uncharacterized protein n=1 Tax=Leptospira borgpetersenii serovar Ballum TaxID=280505 RepID=A0A0S2IUP1_LEPBO|nr:hypothetical protein [Leptospira borgpetersenii]ALO27362.1 hypothetical protein LBBP_03157 [Leptospira borgpetersenii serovar Ballum]EKQ99754.1 hypothetical protein LEP1GSC121_2138 [Leptospira borgpetersenii serovar Castellonis str. 200801910]OOV43173.1 hypothetical protein B1H38_13580 [Leptospira borgpetersenii serovar Ballum]QHE27940.1 hypothetical protein GS524_13930 [Leptospira borgpetersenii]QHE31246.1 hypothetical protein GS523_13930 [Leptospira borgpetersenii]